jgi:hypothetical protein
LADTAFIALYKGRTVGDARLLAVSSDRSIVERFFRELVGEDAVAEKCLETDRRDAGPALALVKYED